MMPTLDYFRQRAVVDPETQCWVWQLTLGWDGYGHCYVIREITTAAHRVAYMVAKGEIPAGLTIDHLCRNRACVNPDHLEAVTQRENTLRAPESMGTVNAHKTHCKNGHEFTQANTHIRKADGARVCRTCSRAAQRRYRTARRAA